MTHFYSLIFILDADPQSGDDTTPPLERVEILNQQIRNMNALITNLRKENDRLKEEAANQVNVDVVGKILGDELCGVANYFKDSAPDVYNTQALTDYTHDSFLASLREICPILIGLIIVTTQNAILKYSSDIVSSLELSRRKTVLIGN